MVLTAGGIALLVWFEINSRRNGARKKQMESSAQSDSTVMLAGKGPSGIERNKAA